MAVAVTSVGDGAEPARKGLVCQLGATSDSGEGMGLTMHVTMATPLNKLPSYGHSSTK